MQKIILILVGLFIVLCSESYAASAPVVHSGYFNLSQKNAEHNFKHAKQYKKPEQKDVSSKELVVVTSMKSCLAELHKTPGLYTKPYKECLKRQEKLKRQAKVAEVAALKQIKSVKTQDAQVQKISSVQNNKFTKKIKNIFQQRQKVERHIGNQ